MSMGIASPTYDIKLILLLYILEVFVQLLEMRSESTPFLCGYGRPDIDPTKSIHGAYR